MANLTIGKSSKLAITLKSVPAKVGTKDEAKQAEVNARIVEANKQVSLGAMFRALGVEKWSSSSAAKVATMSLMDHLLSLGLVNRAVYDVIWHALQGYPDEGSVTMLDVWTLPTLQKQVGWAEKNIVRKSLDSIANLDPAAADLLADCIVKEQAKFAKDNGYHNGLLHSLADAFWRGAKVVVPAIVDPFASVLAPVAVVVVAVVVLVVVLKLKG